ncbi:MAG: hypothetical protein ABI630_01930 [Betaproteobacteria bacterium]
MKSEIRLALLMLATASAPAFAQDTPQCASYFDNAKQIFTAAGAPEGAINRQCFLTVMPKDGPASVAGFPQLSQYPGPVLTEGTYEITLSGGGGGGGGGGLLASGGGGAGAVPYKTTQYLKPGVYKLTMGTGGRGGAPGFVVGGNGEEGAPTSMTMAYSNELVAGFRGAETFARRVDNSYMVASSRNVPAPRADGVIADGQGAQGVAGLGNGGDGGILPDPKGNRAERPAQDGGPMIVAGIPTGQPGRGGMRDGGGGGGAGYGDGGNGKSVANSADYQGGMKGGDGFVKLVPMQVAQASRPVVVAPAPVQPAPYVAPAAARRDRN